MNKLLLMMMGAGILFSCTTGNCRRNGELIQPKSQMIAQNGNDSLDSDSSGIQKNKVSRHVFVYQSDKSIQCTPGSGVSLAKMAQELKGITIYSQERKPDGMHHIQVCGAGTGMMNVYEISEEDLGKALKLGFKKWTF